MKQQEVLGAKFRILILPFLLRLISWFFSDSPAKSTDIMEERKCTRFLLLFKGLLTHVLTLLTYRRLLGYCRRRRKTEFGRHGRVESYRV